MESNWKSDMKLYLGWGPEGQRSIWDSIYDKGRRHMKLGVTGGFKESCLYLKHEITPEGQTRITLLLSRTKKIAYPRWS